MVKPNDKQPIISFILTDYNLPISLLRECIESILALNIKAEDREIILVDDGSEVSPKSALDDLLPDLIYIRQDNQGLSVARNVGIEASCGRFIQFVDGDDCLLDNYNECIKSIQTNDTDLLFFDRVSNKSLPFIGRTRVYGTGINYLLHNNLYSSAWGYIFRKDLLGDDLRFTKGILHEDEEFTPLLTLRAKNVTRYSGSAYFYREREDSIVHSSDTEHISRRIHDFIGIIERLNTKSETLETAARKALKRRVDQLVMDFLYNVVKLTRSKARFDEATSILKGKGLYPLPIKNYTLKYLVFTLLLRTGIGRRILVKYISKIK